MKIYRKTLSWGLWFCGDEEMGWTPVVRKNSTSKESRCREYFTVNDKRSSFAKHRKVNGSWMGIYIRKIEASWWVAVKLNPIASRVIISIK